MTLCIAALCERRQALVLASDKMISQPNLIQAELQIEKVFRIHPDWWVMFSGTTSYVFNVVDKAKEALAHMDHWSIEEVTYHLELSWRAERDRLTDAVYLAPRGWTRDNFVYEGREKLGDDLFRSIDQHLASYRMDLTLLVAGFDAAGQAHIFAVDHPGVAVRHDIPGYHAIGNGMYGASYFMYFREMSVEMSASEALYHVSEAKAFGYQAGSIGEDTDFVVARFGTEPIRLLDAVGEPVSNVLESLWAQFRPPATHGLEVLDEFTGMASPH